MKKLLILFTCIFIFISASAVCAFAADIKIGVIDTQRIIAQSEKIMKVRTDFNKELDARKQELLKKQSDAQALQDEIKTKGSGMTYEVLRNKNEELQKKAKELQRMKDEIEADAQSKEAELSRKFLRQIREVAAEYLKKEKMTLILEKNATIASDDAIDVTDQIIKMYDARP